MRITDLDKIEETLNPKNYIELFVSENGLVVGQPFKISISKRQWFCFREDLSLDIVGDDWYMRGCLDFQSILIRLLMGELHITDRLGQMKRSNYHEH